MKSPIILHKILPVYSLCSTQKSEGGPCYSSVYYYKGVHDQLIISVRP